LSYVYFANAIETKMVKIGQTANVISRMSGLQTGCPFKLNLMGAVSHDLVSEYEVHTALDRFRIRGEWFELSPLVSRVISMLISKDESKITTAARWIRRKCSPPVRPTEQVAPRPGMVLLKLSGFRCSRCEHEWVPRIESDDEPRVCPKCKSPYWDRPRRDTKKSGKKDGKK